MGDLQLVGKADDAANHRLRNRLADVGGHNAVAHPGAGEVVNIFRNVLLQPVVVDVVSP